MQKIIKFYIGKQYFGSVHISFMLYPYLMIDTALLWIIINFRLDYTLIFERRMEKRNEKL